MPDLHTTNGRAAPESHETVSSVSTPPWVAEGISRATYYRRKAANNSAPELNGQQINESELKAETPELNQPEIKSEPSPELNAPKPTAEEYEQKIIPKADEATERLKQQLQAINQAQEIQRRQQQQADEITRQINQAFDFWKSQGLTPAQEQLLRSAPGAMVQLSAIAADEAAKRHQVGSAEYVQEGTRLFFENLGRLENEVRASQQAQQPSPAMPQPTIPPAPSLLDPIPAPRQQNGRSSIVSAPVSRDTPGGRRYEADRDPGQMTLTAAQAEAARIAGIDYRTYAENLLKMERMKRDGSFNNQ